MSAEASSHLENLPSRRPWHIAARLAVGLVLVVGLLANIPGELQVTPNILKCRHRIPGFTAFHVTIVHGWPWVVLAHDGCFDLKSGTISAWCVGNAPHFRIAPLLADILVILGGAIAVGWYLNRWIRTLFLRFHLTHLLMLTLVIAGAVGYVTYRYRLHQAQHNQRNITMLSIMANRLGPFWLRELTGHTVWSWADISVIATVKSGDTVNELSRKETLRILTIQHADQSELPSLSEFTSLQVLNLEPVNWNEAALYDPRQQDETWFTPLLPSLRKIAQCSSLEALNLSAMGLIDQDLAELATLPKLTNVCLSDNLGVTDNGLVHLSKLKAIRQIDLNDTNVTEAGITRLQMELPDCCIEWSGTP